LPHLEAMHKNKDMQGIQTFLNSHIPIPDLFNIPPVLRRPFAVLTATRTKVSSGHSKIQIEGTLTNINPETFRFNIGKQVWKACNVEYVSPLVYKFQTNVTLKVEPLTGTVC
jgi:hypothetical protein